MDQPLAGVRVIELSEGIAGPYAAKLFADFGADVIKVEPSRGDVARRLGPFPDGDGDGDGDGDPELSALHLHLNTNKRSVVADLDDEDGVALVRRLVSTADIVIESFAPGTLEAAGLGFDALRELRPGVVLTSITPFGQDGPYAGYAGEEIVTYAMAGPMHATGVSEREPLKLAGHIISYQCGNLAATATMGALMSAEGDGEGVWVDVSLFEAQAGSVDRRSAFLLNYAYTGRIAEREGTSRLSPAPVGIYPTADGYVQIVTIPAWVPRMIATVGSDALAKLYDDPGWMVDPTVPDASDVELYPWLLARTKEEATTQAQSHRWAITPVNQPVEVLEDEHFTARGFWATVNHPGAGPLRQPGPPLRMEGGWAVRRGAPRLGEHQDEVLAELAELAAGTAGAAADAR